VAEAWTCYGVGAYRATIVLTWLAVFADLTEKIAHLAREGDADAKQYQRIIDDAEQHGLAPAGVQRMQEAERTLLKHASDLGLIDGIVTRQMERLREDRHLCAHPSLLPLGESYVPSAESARSHLACALDGVLCHPPTQGRAIVDRFAASVADPAFMLVPEHFLQTYYERVRPVARARIADLAAKHAVLAVDVGDPAMTALLAERLAACLNVIAERDRELARVPLLKALARLAEASTAGLLDSISVRRAGQISLFWELMDDAMLQRVKGAMTPIRPTNRWGSISDRDAGIAALAGVPAACERVPGLYERFEALSLLGKDPAMRLQPARAFAPFVADLLTAANQYREAERVTSEVVLPHAAFLNLQQLSDCLNA
jgi:hypothetical protein